MKGCLYSRKANYHSIWEHMRGKIAMLTMLIPLTVLGLGSDVGVHLWVHLWVQHDSC